MHNSRPTIGVLAGAQVYYGTILGNFIGPVLQGVHAAAQERGCNWGAGPTITVDNESGVHQAVQRLVEHGHRHHENAPRSRLADLCECSRFSPTILCVSVPLAERRCSPAQPTVPSNFCDLELPHDSHCAADRERGSHKQCPHTKEKRRM